MDASYLFDAEFAETTRLDETIVDGANHHQYSSLYQVDTCIRVTPCHWSGEVDRRMLSATSDVVAVAVENDLLLFSIIDRQLITARSFQSPIDCIAFNDDGALLVVAECAGNIYAISGKTGEQLVSRQLLSTKSNNDGALFKAVEFGGGSLSRLAVLTSRGPLHVIDGLQTGQPKHSVIDVTNTSTSCLTIVPNGDIVTADDSLNLWSNDDGEEFEVVSSCPLILGPAIKCSALPGGDKLIVLDSSGYLMLWSMARFVAISILDCASVADFLLVDRPPVDSRYCVGTIAVLQRSEISGCINIYSLPSTELVYSIDVHQGALLFPSPISNDSVYFLESTSENAAIVQQQTDAAFGLQVRRLAETDPQTRLRRLLAKQRFSEAESFVEKFGLDVQCVYRDYASHLVTKLSATSADGGEVNVGELISELMRCLGLLNDVQYVIECTVSMTLPTLAVTNQLLTLAHDRLRKSDRSSFTELHDSLAEQLHETSRRLAAFQVIIIFSCISYLSNIFAVDIRNCCC